MKTIKCLMCGNVICRIVKKITKNIKRKSNECVIAPKYLEAKSLAVKCSCCGFNQKIW